MSRTAGAVRIGVVVAAVAAATAAATVLPGTVRVGSATAATGTAQASSVPVRLAQLTCAGPETEGIPGVAAVPGGSTTVYAATAPAEALAGLVAPSGDGQLTVRAMPAATGLGETTTRAATVTAPLQGPSSAEVTGTGALAPGVAALQTWLRRDGDDRGLVSAACASPQSDVWLVAGGGDATRRERLVVANPGGNTVTVDVQVYGAGGPVASASGSRVTVPPHGRVGMLVDALASGEKTPVVHVKASGGSVTAVLQDSWIEGAVGRGSDDAAGAEAPGTEQVVPAVYLDGPAKLRILAPGDSEAVVQARLLGTQGPQALPDDGVLRVPAGSVRELDLGSAPAGAYAVQVHSDQPVVAGVMIERRPAGNGPSDLAWVASTAAVPALTGIPLPDGAKAELMLVATGAPASATVLTVAANGAATSKSVDLESDSVASLEVSGARSVWVRPGSGTVRAGLALSLAGDAPLFSVVGMRPLAVTVTELPVRQIQR